MPSSPRPPAEFGVRVPWRVARATPRHPRIENAGTDDVDDVRVFAGRDSGRDQRFGTLMPGDAVDVCLCGVDLDSAVVTIAWFRRSTDIEYLWRFVI